MIDPSPHPSRQLRIFACIARWSLGLMLAFWLLLAAAWGTLHGFIVPRIGEWRAEVERLATQTLGAPVRIDAISANSQGIFPTIHLDGVRVLDAQGRDALKLQGVVATVSARSLLRLGLEQLYIDAPYLDIRHLHDGRWQVAGLDVVQSDATESSGLDWLLEQPELVIRKGQVHFTDERRAVNKVQLLDVDVVLRNRHWSHVLRVDATPAVGDGERMQLIGAFRQPLLPSTKAPWTRWSGQWYASAHLQQVPQLPWPEVWGVQAMQGHGAARAWIDVQQGRIAGFTADLALAQAQVQWRDQQVADLALQKVQGRFVGRLQEHSWALEGQGFSFRHADGSVWPTSNWAVNTVGAGSASTRTQIELDFADLGMASKVVQGLPVPASVLEGLGRLAPSGELRQLQLQWQASGWYQASGRVQQLMLQPQPALAGGVGVPGVEGLNATFDLNANGGKASLEMQAGSLHFPGVFEEPEVPLDALQAQVRWTVKDGHVKVEVPKAQFANADAQGTLQAMWQMGAHAQDRLPGHLQLEGVLERANGARVHRYLPLQVPELARHYVRDSVKQGRASQVAFEVRGNLKDMPFDRPETGRFWIQAPVKDVTYEFMPPSLRAAGTPSWPALTQLHGTLVFEGAGMKVLQAGTGFAGHPQLRMASIDAQIPNLQHPNLMLKASGLTDLNAALGLVKQSPLAGVTSHALDHAKAQGNAQIAFDLDLPIEHVEKTKVHGHVGFEKNSLQFNPSVPQLQQLQGKVQFHDQGFDLLNVQGQTLGGIFKMEGGMPSLQQGVRLQAKGVATAPGMQKDGNVPLMAQIAASAQGQSAYTVDVTASGAMQKVWVRSDLRGMALNLPAPMNKAADEMLALSVMQTLHTRPPQTQELRVDVAGRGGVSYVQDMSVSPSKVVRGRIAVGEVPAGEDTAAEGVVADVRLPVLDVDAWATALAAAHAGAPSVDAGAAQAWLPQRVQLKVDRLLVQGRELDAVNADFSQTQGVWRGRLNAKHFAGTVEYRAQEGPESAGKLSARLSHLSIPKSEVQRLNHEPAEAKQSDVESLPALDIEVERLEIADKSLGKLQLKARNSPGAFGREWMLEQFDLTTPEARWRANGYWGAAGRGMPRSTHLSFLLEMESSGKLLERLGMPGVIRDGQGLLSGNIAWRGAPVTPHWQSMDGGVHMQVEKGQFLKVEPGIGKLLSVLSLQSITRRMTLDFRDVFSQGFAFDYIRGDISVAQGIARTNNLQMKGLNAAVLMEGKASLVDETQDLKVVVVPEINAMTASLAATAINPVIGLGSFLAQMFLRGPLMEAATRIFHVHGTWTDPLVEPVNKKVLQAPQPPEGVAP